MARRCRKSDEDFEHGAAWRVLKTGKAARVARELGVDDGDVPAMLVSTPGLTKHDVLAGRAVQTVVQRRDVATVFSCIAKRAR